MNYHQILKFWPKTVLQALVPGGIGYSKSLQKYKDQNYQHESEKHAVRNKHFGKSGWKNEKNADGIQYRDYENYDEYLTHQKVKWDEMLKIQGGLDQKTVLKYRVQFFDRFKDAHEYIPYDAKILCLGARQGTEVEVLRDLGFSEALGVDLNPGPNNPYVVEGDFLNLKFENHTIDLLYTNAIDHAFDLPKLFQEHARVLKKDGYALYDIALQDGGVFESVHWDEEEVLFSYFLKFFKKVVSVKIDHQKRWKSVLLQGVRSE